MKSKWFDFDVIGMLFTSKRIAKNRKQAMEKSIEKWNLIVGGWLPTDDVLTCGLCDLYYEFSGCPKCPVFKKTGQEYCDNTPYIDWYRSGAIADAKQELRFLKSLSKQSK